MRGDFGGGGGFAEARDVFVFARAFISPPCVVGSGDFLQIGVGQLAVNAVDEGAEFPRVDDEGLFAAVAEAAFGVGVFVFREEPEADGNLRAVEELAGERDHAVHEVGLDEGLSYFAFAGLVGGHAAIGEDEAGHALRREVMNKMLHPGEVGVALRRDAELPAHVVVFAEPVGIVEGRIVTARIALVIGVDAAGVGK